MPIYDLVVSASSVQAFASQFLSRSHFAFYPSTFSAPAMDVSLFSDLIPAAPVRLLCTVCGPPRPLRGRFVPTRAVLHVYVIGIAARLTLDRVSVLFCLLVVVEEAVAPADVASAEAPDVDVDPPAEGMDHDPVAESTYEEIPHEGVATWTFSRVGWFYGFGLRRSPH